MPLKSAPGHSNVELHNCQLVIFNPRTKEIRVNHRQWSCFIKDGIIVKMKAGLNAQYLGRKFKEVREELNHIYIPDII